MSTPLGQISNRRRESRSPVRARVYLLRPGERMCRCTARDLSRVGAFLELEPSGVRVGTPIQVVFALELVGVTRLYRVPGLVVRLGGDGVGVCF
jgi:hypothetical protein